MQSTICFDTNETVRGKHMITFTMLSTSLQMHAEHGSDEDIFKISVQNAHLDLFKLHTLDLFKIQKNPNCHAIFHWCHDHVPCGS